LTYLLTFNNFQDENHGKKSDFIQLFVEAQTAEPLEKEFLADSKDGQLEMQQMKIAKKLTTGVRKKKHSMIFTETNLLQEIVQQCLLFLLAGFDTTANSLAYISYLLAKNPDAQEKLISEIDAYCPNEVGRLHGPILIKSVLFTAILDGSHVRDSTADALSKSGGEGRLASVSARRIVSVTAE
jgi:hypothetical protein